MRGVTVPPSAPAWRRSALRTRTRALTTLYRPAFDIIARDQTVFDVGSSIERLAYYPTDTAEGSATFQLVLPRRLTARLDVSVTAVEQQTKWCRAASAVSEARFCGRANLCVQCRIPILARRPFSNSPRPGHRDDDRVEIVCLFHTSLRHFSSTSTIGTLFCFT